MLSFEELEPALHKWAYHFENDKFDHWELINQVWLVGSVQKLKHIQYASQRIKWDMMDYMRRVDKIKLKQRLEKRGECFKKTYFLSIFNNDDTQDREYQIKDLFCSDDELEMKDLIGYLMKGCSSTIKLIVKLRLLENFTNCEIGKVVGISESRVSQLLTLTMKSVALKAKKVYDIRNNGKKKKILSHHNRDIEKELFYNHLYYQVNKEKIQIRRRQLKEERATQSKITVDNS